MQTRIVGSDAMRRLIWTTIVLASAATAPALAQTEHHRHQAHSAPADLKHPGQAAFGALSEVVALLEADPSTDWSKVDITRLREHLVDMDEVVMRADADVEERGEQIRITYKGTGRTLDAIRRMIPAHAKMMNAYRNWKSETEIGADRVVWILTAKSAEERVRIRALGPFGLLTLGSHHGPHHLAMARGLAIHAH